MADLTTKKRNKLGDATFAFPRQRKEPLENLSHARNAMARLNQVEGVSDEERAEAKRRIIHALKKFGAKEYQDDGKGASTGDADVREMDGTQTVNLPQHPRTQQTQPDGVDGNGDTDDDDYPDTTRGPGGTEKALAGPGKPVGLKDPKAVLARGDASQEDGEDGEDGEDVRESVPLSMPVDVPDRIPVRFMTSGRGNMRDGHEYLPEAVQALPAHIKRQPKMFLDHSDPDKVRRVGHRSLRDLAGIAVRETVHYDPIQQACVGEVVLHPQFRDWIKTAQLARDDIGLSVDAIGDFIPGTKKCRGWRAFNSVDFVPKGGAGGFTTLPVREADSLTADQYAEMRTFDMLTVQNMTAEELQAEAPALYQSIVDAAVAQVREAAAAHNQEPSAATQPSAEDAERIVRESDAYQALVRENEALRTDNAAIVARVDEIEAEKNRTDTALFVAKTIRECASTLTDAQVAYLASEKFDGATVGAKGAYADAETLAASVRESAERYVATLPKVTASGEITGLGGRVTGVVRESGYTNPLEARTAVIDGLALDFGHPLSTPAN